MPFDAAPVVVTLWPLVAAGLLVLATIGGVFLSVSRRRIGGRSLYAYDREQRQLAAFRRRLGRRQA